MNNNTKKENWYKNKIKGGLAEEICMNHFQYLGFDVSRCGIEHVAPEYTKYANRIDAKSNNVKKVLNKIPDLLVSNGDKAFLVEVKFSSTIKNNDDFYKYADKLLFDYRYMLFRCNDLGSIDDRDEFEKILRNLKDSELQDKLCEDFIFYVVLQNKDETYKSYVHIFIPKNYKADRKKGLGWKNARSNPIGVENFGKGYTKIVEPLLDELFTSRKANT